MICKICGKDFQSNIGFGTHIIKQHKIPTQQYYDTYFHKPLDGYCKVCGKPTHFKNVISGYNEYCLACSHNSAASKQKRKETNLKKYGVDNVLKSKIFKDKIKQTLKAKYGDEYITRTVYFKEKSKQTSRKKYGVDYPIQNKTVRQQFNRYYKYNNIVFDSSWEVAVYIYCQDNNIPIEYEPITLTYVDSVTHQEHKYFPDFRIFDKIIEIKGAQYIDKDGTLKDKDKQKCIDANNIIIWSYADIKQYLIYCEEKYVDKYWYKKFKYKKPRTIVYVPKIKDNPMKCCICNQIFQNGNYLAAHLRFVEHINGKEYYDKFYKKLNEGICIVCGKPTKYINFSRGYTLTCCQKCNNNPLSTKGKNVSKTKQKYTKEQKTIIMEKRKNTCLTKYGVPSNLMLRKLTK